MHEEPRIMNDCPEVLEIPRPRLGWSVDGGDVVAVASEVVLYVALVDTFVFYVESADLQVGDNATTRWCATQAHTHFIRIP